MCCNVTAYFAGFELTLVDVVWPTLIAGRPKTPPPTTSRNPPVLPGSKLRSPKVASPALFVVCVSVPSRVFGTPLLLTARIEICVPPTVAPVIGSVARTCTVKFWPTVTDSGG